MENQPVMGVWDDIFGKVATKVLLDCQRGCCTCGYEADAVAYPEYMSVNCHD